MAPVLHIYVGHVTCGKIHGRHLVLQVCGPKCKHTKLPIYMGSQVSLFSMLADSAESVLLLFSCAYSECCVKCYSEEEIVGLFPRSAARNVRKYQRRSMPSQRPSSQRPPSFELFRATGAETPGNSMSPPPACNRRCPAPGFGPKSGKQKLYPSSPWWYCKVVERLLPGREQKGGWPNLPDFHAASRLRRLLPVVFINSRELSMSTMNSY